MSNNSLNLHLLDDAAARELIRKAGERDALAVQVVVQDQWISLVNAQLTPKRYYLAWNRDRRMAFMLTGEQIDLMNESSTAEHLSMDLTHYKQMPVGPEADLPEAAKQVAEWREKSAKWDESKMVEVALDAKLTEVLKEKIGFADRDFELACALLGALVDSAFGKAMPDNGLVCSVVLANGDEIFIEARRRTGEPYVKQAEVWRENSELLEARAVAAEMVIAKMHSALSDEADYCSDDGPNEAMRWQGKLEFYSRMFRESGYAAARELMRKADLLTEICDGLNAFMTMQRCSTFVTPDRIDHAVIEYATRVESERDSLAAQVVVMREAIGTLRHWHNTGREDEGTIVATASWKRCHDAADLAIPEAAKQVEAWKADSELLDRTVDALRSLYMSADCEWETGAKGHDWSESMSIARGVLTEIAARAQFAAKEGK